MIKPGDKVRFLNENMEGIVTTILGKNQIGVTVDDDFEIPVLISEVVKVAFEERAGNVELGNETKSPRIASNQTIGIFLAFERKGETDLEIHIHNNLSENLQVLIYQKDRGIFNLQKVLKLERDETVLIGKSKLSEFESWKPYEFVFLPYQQTTVQLSPAIITSLGFQAKTFHGYWKHCEFLKKQAYVFRLDEPAEKLNLKILQSKDFSEKSNITPIDFKAKPTSVIDLHYETLKENGYGSSEDITGFQMDVFTRTLEAGYVHRLKEMTFIHGVGNAYLKNKIRTYLSKHPEMVSKFEDADLLKFGNGATLVHFK